MPAISGVDELVLNHSFIDFCFNADAKDYLSWQQYISEHSAALQKFQEAKKRVQKLRGRVRRKHTETSGYVAADFSNIRRRVTLSKAYLFTAPFGKETPEVFSALPSSYPFHLLKDKLFM